MHGILFQSHCVQSNIFTENDSAFVKQTVLYKWNRSYISYNIIYVCFALNLSANTQHMNINVNTELIIPVIFMCFESIYNRWSEMYIDWHESILYLENHTFTVVTPHWVPKVILLVEVWTYLVKCVFESNLHVQVNKTSQRYYSSALSCYSWAILNTDYEDYVLDVY